MREFLLMLAAMFLVSILAVPVVILGSIFRKEKKKYWETVAIGFDQVGGSLLYGTEDWTISSWTHYNCKFRKKHCWFESLIDLIFGKGHCKRSHENEKSKGLI